MYVMVGLLQAVKTYKIFFMTKYFLQTPIRVLVICGTQTINDQDTSQETILHAYSTSYFHETKPKIDLVTFC